MTYTLTITQAELDVDVNQFRERLRALTQITERQLMVMTNTINYGLILAVDGYGDEIITQWRRNTLASLHRLESKEGLVMK